MTDAQLELLALIPDMSNAEVKEFNESEDEFSTVLHVHTPGSGSNKTTGQIIAIFDAVQDKAEYLEVITALNGANFVCASADGGGKPGSSRPGRPSN